MEGETEPDNVQQEAIVWPPAPTYTPIESAVNHFQAQTKPIVRVLNRGIFLFVGGCLVPAGLLAISSILQLPGWVYQPGVYVLIFLWGAFFLAATYFSVSAVCRAAHIHHISLVIQSLLVTLMSLFFMITPLLLFFGFH